MNNAASQLHTQHTIHTMEYNNSRREEKKNYWNEQTAAGIIETYGLRTLTNTHTHTNSQPTNRNEDNINDDDGEEKKWNELNRKTKRFNFICPVCSSVGIVLLRGEHSIRDRQLSVHWVFALCVFFFSVSRLESFFFLIKQQQEQQKYVRECLYVFKYFTLGFVFNWNYNYQEMRITPEFSPNKSEFYP